MTKDNIEKVLSFVRLAFTSGLSNKDKIHHIKKFTRGSNSYDFNSSLSPFKSSSCQKKLATLERVCKDWLCKSKLNHIICYDDEFYPSNLKLLYDPPIVVFCQGNLNLLRYKSIAIVGSRVASDYSKDIAHSFSSAFSSIGVSPISGLAKGIDTVVAQAALRNRASTIAVIGNGHEITYPKSNKQLQYKLKDLGLILSEYPPYTPPLAINFPRRNRIISALSEGVCVIEAKLKSGSLITAKFGLDLGKDIFVVPGPIVTSSYSGSHNLIQNGAKLVMHHNDIIEEMPHLLRVSSNHQDNVIKAMYQCHYHISNKDISYNELKNILESNEDDLNSALLELELYNFIHHQRHGYSLARLYKSIK